MWALRGAAAISPRNRNSHFFLSQTTSIRTLARRSNSDLADGKCGRIQHTNSGSAFSKIVLYDSPLFSKNFTAPRSLCSLVTAEAGFIKQKGESSNQEPQGSDKTSIDMDNQIQEAASDIFYRSNLEDDSAVDDNLLNLSDSELASCSAGDNSPALYRRLIEASPSSINDILEKWIKDGNVLDRGEVSVTMLTLQKQRFYRESLQFLEWLEARRCFSFVEHDYASHLDLIAKVHGLQQVETYIKKIPESFRGEIVYRTYLANCVAALNVKKAEEVFNTIRANSLPITVFSCDQLLLLYKRVDKMKISDVLSLMEKEDIKPSIFTYRLLIDLKGHSYDITGMEQIVEKMKGEGMWPDLTIQSIIAGFYISGGVYKKAEAVLKEMEGVDIKENRSACRVLIRLYASLDKATDVGRIWKVCETNPLLVECVAAIKAWGKLGQVEKAEDVFVRALELRKKDPSILYDALLWVYASKKLLIEGEDLVKRMKESGLNIGPSTCDALVNLYVESGELGKADYTVLREARKNKIRPFHASYLTLLKEYSNRGDIQNAEKIFQELKQTRFIHRMKLYQLLLQAYLNAKSPAYGFRERMRADNVFPDRQLAEQLVAVDALQRTNTETEALNIQMNSINSKQDRSSSLYKCWTRLKNVKGER